MELSIKPFIEHKKIIHLVGIGGVSMNSLGELLLSMGVPVTGSDRAHSAVTERLERLGAVIHYGHAAENVEGASLIIRTAAVHDDNPEIVRAHELNIPVMERAQAWGCLMTDYQDVICLSGTHGKTTATSMITSLLELAGQDPAAVIGGKLPLIGGYGKNGSGNTIVIEACEFAETFLHLTPDIAVLLNIDNDHLDYYGTMGQLKFAFKKFALMARHTIVANADDTNVVQVINSLDRAVRTFGINSEADYQAVNIREHKPGFYEFDVLEWGYPVAHLKLSAPGYHNIYNALAMAACCFTVGLTGEDAAAAAESFKGAGRRFEILGEFNGVTVADDYAHHPTEIAATLKTAHALGYNKVWAVHQPFTYSRTRELLDDFAKVLADTDQVVLTPIMGSREVDDGSVKSEDLAAKIPGCVVVAGLKEAADYVKEHAQPGDFVITMGCGDIYKAAHMMLE